MLSVLVAFRTVVIFTGFVHFLESPGIKKSNFQGTGKSYNRAQVLENPGKLHGESLKVPENKQLWVEMRKCYQTP